MKNKKVIASQIASYEKSYEETKDFDEFKSNIYSAILDLEKITPVSPFFSSYLFRIKLDCENMDRFNSSSIIDSLETFLERLDS